MNECDPKRTVIEHANGFTMVNIRALEPSTDPYVLPSQCEQIFCLDVLGNASWAYIVKYDPRGIPMKYNIVEEEDDDADQEQVAADVSDEKVEEVNHPNVLDNVLINDIDDDIIENYVDGDGNMHNPFNNFDSETYQDSNVDLDAEEEDE